MSTRGESIQQRFAVGKTVFVSSTIPATREWPGVAAEMNQFFCGEELKVLSIQTHPDDPDRIALELDTKAHGCKRNHLFSAEWVSATDAPLPELTLAHPVKRARRTTANVDQSKVDEIRDFLKAADQKLAELDTSRNLSYRSPAAREVLKKFEDHFADVKKQMDAAAVASVGQEAAAPVPEPAPATKNSHEIGWSTAIGGALAGVFATALAQSRAKKRTASATPALFIPPLEAEPVVQEQTVPCLETVAAK